MKKLLALLIALTLLSACSAFASTIGAGVPDHLAYEGYAKISKQIDRANVRDANGEIIAQLKPGSKVYVKQEDWKYFNLGGEFARIDWEGEEMYVYATNFEAYDQYRVSDFEF